MRVVVCIKQVPDTTEIKIDPRTNTLKREGVKGIINPYDKNALELALQLREKHGGKVTVLSMGPPQAKEALREAMAMGADEVILISDRAFGGSDTLATSYTLARAIERLQGFDLVLLGKQAIDGDTGQVGPGVAEHLGIGQVTYARLVEVEGSRVKVHREGEGEVHLVEGELPLLITVTEEINKPRYPSVRGMLRARKAEIPVWSAEDLGVDLNRIGLQGSPTQVKKVFTPPAGPGGEILEGAPEQVAAELVEKLKEMRAI